MRLLCKYGEIVPRKAPYARTTATNVFRAKFARAYASIGEQRCLNMYHLTLKIHVGISLNPLQLLSKE